MEFVGSPLRLQALVNLLCGEIANAYASQVRAVGSCAWQLY
jgi:hypothetical protein